VSTPLAGWRTGRAVSYCLHVPGGPPPPGGFALLVVVHDTTRNAENCRDMFAGFAERHGCLVLAPLFPAGATGPADVDNYKFVAAGRTRFDRILLEMAADVARQHPVQAGRFLLHGFSGGAQFAHRFFYLHPERLAAVSIAAPGRVTPLDYGQPWWGGVSDTARIFGRPVDPAALRAVPAQILVGGNDTGPTEPGHPAGPASTTGPTRSDRARFLHDSLVGNGITCRLDIVPGAAHEHTPLLASAQRFLAGWLSRLQD
jgi:poly(3-hydroxybutyrate) depolymerase